MVKFTLDDKNNIKRYVPGCIYSYNSLNMIQFNRTAALYLKYFSDCLPPSLFTFQSGFSI